MVILLAILSALCFGVALVTGRLGLRTLDARAGAAISIPTATLFFVMVAPFVLDITGWSVNAIAVFALVGLFFPAFVTLLTFRANEALGPTITSAVSGTAPLFALLAAAIFLGERVPPEAAAAAVGVVVGVALLTWRRGAASTPLGAALGWPVAGAVMRGLAQVGAKAGLALWPNPFAAGLIGYLVSTATVLVADRSRRRRATTTWGSVLWFGCTGLLNGAAVLLMYAALNRASVSIVAPIVATYPLVTALVSTLVLREDRLTPHKAAGALITVAAIVYLVASNAPA